MRTFAAVLAAGLAARAAGAGVVPVATTAELVAAIDAAQPGDVITLAAGTYTVTQNLLCDVAGTADHPIVVRAAALGEALLRFDTVEGFKVSRPFWRFENLDIQGVCALHSDCEHAFHVVGQADGTVVRGCRLRDFNAMIKGNGEGAPYLFPDDVLVEGNEFFDSAARQTSNPVTPIDVVGGRRWVIRGNFIHDHAKAQGDHVSYAAFLKGNSRDGLFERNLVVCELLHAGEIRLGLSFGGGGSSPDPICEDGTCTPEHQNGTMRNNIVRDCPQDVGIYLNEAANAGIYGNLLYHTTGIDVRFAATSADLRDNLLSGQIRNRDGGTSSEGSNLENVTDPQWAAWYVDPAAGDFTLVDGGALVDQGEAVAALPDDYCGRARDGAPDLGAFEYGPLACDPTLPAGGGDLFRDGFESGGAGAWSFTAP